MQGPTKPFRTARLHLTPLSAGDAPDLARALSDPALYRHIGGEPPSVTELASTIARYLDGPGIAGDAWHNWAIRLPDGTVIGHLQATVTAGGAGADIAWVVGTEWQGRGYASEAAAALVQRLAASRVGVITAHVHPDNVASAHVAARAGLDRTAVIEGGEIVWRARPRTGENGRR